MPHAQYIQAQHVLSHVDDYPSVIIYQAQKINNWFSVKRELIKFLVDNRNIWVDYIRLRNTFSLYHTQIAHRKIFSALRLKYSSKAVNAVHQFRSYRRRTGVNTIELECVEFTAMLWLQQSLDYHTLYYCFGFAHHRDHHLLDSNQVDIMWKRVANLRHIQPNAMVEILMWKLMKFNNQECCNG